MPLKLAQIQPLLGTSELALVAQTFRPPLAGLPEGRIKSKIERARKLRDKYRDAAKRQSRSARGKGRAAPSSTTAARSAASAKRAEIFHEAIGRLQSELRSRGAARKAEKAKQAKREKKKATAKRVAQVRAATAAKKAKPKRRKSTTAATGGERPMAIARDERRKQRTADLRTRAHVAARGRRQQARKDAR